MASRLPLSAALLGLLLSGVAALAADTPATGTYPPAAYAAFGSSLVQTAHLGELGWNEAQFNAFLEGMRASFQGKPVPMDGAARDLAAEMGRKIQAIATGPAAGAPAEPAVDPRERLARYFKEMQKRLGLQISDDGLGYNVTTSDSGVRPRPVDTIVLTVQAVAANGVTKLPQLSAEHIRARLGGMLPGLAEGIQMMTVGAHAVFVIPPSLSFAAGAWPEGVEPGAPLIYYVTLEGVTPAR
jgi:FKBP-type peptidyl-prolyl cis-trans isomerase